MTLRIEHLAKTYPNGTQALRDVSLTIPQGMFGLLGPNGAGKSTLMRILATLQEADAGSATLAVDGGASPLEGRSDGKASRRDGAAVDASVGDGRVVIDVLRDKDAVRRTLGYLPQEFGLYPKVSAEELLDHFAVLKGVVDRRERRELVAALLHQTNLWEARRKHLGGYSGGMRQRFGIAVALIGNPRLIIVDEPTAGLDPAERVRFLNLLAELGTQSVVILSTHIVEDVSELCSRMAIIDRGTILLEDEPLGAVRALQGKVWRKIVGRDDLPALEQSRTVISTKLLAGRTVVRVFADERPDPTFEATEATLEDVYFAVMKGAIGRTAARSAAEDTERVGAAV